MASAAPPRERPGRDDWFLSNGTFQTGPRGCRPLLRQEVKPRIGLALGLKPRKVGVHENISKSMPLLKEKGLA